VQVAKPDTDAQLAEAATQWSAKQVRELAVAAQRQTDQQAAGNYSRRFLRFDDRRRSFTGCLPEDHYARVKGALITRAARRARDQTPFEQRMADALVEVCERGRSADPRSTGSPGGLGTPISPTWPVAAEGRSSTCWARSHQRWPVAWRATPRSSCPPTALKGSVSSKVSPAGTRTGRNGSRSDAGTRDAVFRAARTPTSPMSTTSSTGFTGVRPPSRIW